jgi:MbtH protein
MPNTEGPDVTYTAVVNHEEQYSIWSANRENALGWTEAGKGRTKEECLEYINQIWRYAH